MPAKRAPEVVGKAVDELTLAERVALTGKYVARELYTPETTPLRRIEAIGDSVEACVRALRQRGLEPKRFEFTRLQPPY